MRDAVWAVVNQEVRDPYEARWLLDRVHERLVKGEDYDLFVVRDFRASVESICRDLGLTPDWSRWSDDDGFTREDGAPHYDWTSGYRYSATTAENYSRIVERQANAEAALQPEPHSRQ